MDFPFQLRTDTRFDVAGFGTNAVDYLIRVPAFPAHDSKMEISGYTVEPGGEVASTLVGLQRLGLSTSYAGRFGSDHAGELGRQSLEKEGVDLGFARTAHGAATQSGFILVDENTGERTVLWHRDRRLAYATDEAPIEAASIARVLHMTPHDAGACALMARAARAAGVIVSLDIDRVFEGVAELLPLVHIMTAAKQFAFDLSGKEGPAALVDMQHRFGCPLVAVTLGDHGSLAICGGTLIETKAFDVPGGCRDTTGAGDAFRTGLLYGLLSGASVEDSFRSANAVASLKCGGPGARSALPDKQGLTSFINSYRRG